MLINCQRSGSPAVLVVWDQTLQIRKNLITWIEASESSSVHSIWKLSTFQASRKRKKNSLLQESLTFIFCSFPVARTRVNLLRQETYTWYIEDLNGFNCRVIWPKIQKSTDKRRDSFYRRPSKKRPKSNNSNLKMLKTSFSFWSFNWTESRQYLHWSSKALECDISHLSSSPSLNFEYIFSFFPGVLAVTVVSDRTPARNVLPTESPESNSTLIFQAQLSIF